MLAGLICFIGSREEQWKREEKIWLTASHVPAETHPKPIWDEFRTDVAESSPHPTATVPAWSLTQTQCVRKESFHAEHNSAWAHEAVKRDGREKEKLMHGIADPLTKLSLCTHRGAASTTRSVRERGDAVGRRDRARLTRRTRLCEAGHVRRLFTRSFSLGKTWNGAPAWSQIRCSPPGAQHERAKLNRAACYEAGWSDCAAPAAAMPAPTGKCCKRYLIRGTFSRFS